MNHVELARRAYGTATSPTLTSRDAEKQVLSQVTADLRRAADGASFATLAAALHNNRLLWTRLASDVAEPGNGLPQELRARIFYLAEFTQAHSRKVLRGEADVDALVEVNTAVMRGLGGRPAAAVAQPPATAPAHQGAG